MHIMSENLGSGKFGEAVQPLSFGILGLGVLDVGASRGFVSSLLRAAITLNPEPACKPYPTKLPLRVHVPKSGLLGP